MRLAIYYPIHFIGVFLLFLAIGGMCLYVRNGGSKEDNPSRKFLAIIHGISLVMVIIGGMGLMTAYQIHKPSMPVWIYLKMAIWLFFGFSSLLIYKLPKLSTVFLIIFVLLGAFAGISAKFRGIENFLNLFG